MSSPTRAGKPVCLTFEFEALEILQRLAASRKAQRILLSTLLRQEEARRIEARKLRERLYATVEEVLTAP